MDGTHPLATDAAGEATCPAARPARRTWVRKSATAVIVAADGAVDEMLGWAPEDLVGKTSLDLIHPDDQTLAVENWMQMLGAPGPAKPLRLRHRHRDGSWRWVEMVNHNLLDDPARAYVQAEMVAVPDDEMAAEVRLRAPHHDGPAAENRPLQLHEALRSREQVLHRLAEALPVGVLHVDAVGRVLYTNRRLHVILDNARASTFQDQLSTVVAEDRPKVEDAFANALRGGLDNDIDVRIATGDAPADAPGQKEIRQCTLSIRTLSSEDGLVMGAVACLVDVTDSVRMRDELRLRATFDTLTACYNRASTMEALNDMLASGALGTCPAVIFVDLDGFKGVNDHLGHGAGDELLEIVARRLKRAVRANDVVGRIGGDEFLVLCPGVDSVAKVRLTAARVMESLQRPVTLRSAEVSCRASVGASWSRSARVDADTLIGQADAAMYEAKRSDCRHPVIYGESAR